MKLNCAHSKGFSTNVKMCPLCLLCVLIVIIGTSGNSTDEMSSNDTFGESCTCPSDCQTLGKYNNSTVQLFKAESEVNQIFCVSPYETEWVLGWDSEEIPLRAAIQRYFSTTPAQNIPNSTNNDRMYCPSLTVGPRSSVWRDTSPLFVRCQETGENEGSSRWYKLDAAAANFGLADPSFSPKNFSDLHTLNDVLNKLQEDSPEQENRSNGDSRVTKASKIPTSHIPESCNCPGDCYPLETNKNIVDKVFRSESSKDQIFCLSPYETEWVFGWNSDKVPLNTSTEHYFETPSAEFRPNALKGGDYCASLTVADWSPVWNTTNLFLRCQRTGAEKGPSSWFKFVVYSNVQRPVTKLERQRIEFKPMQWKDLKSLNEALKNPHEGPSTMTVILAVSGGAAACVVLSLILVVTLMKKVKEQRKEIEMSKEEIDEFMLGVATEKARAKGINGLFILPYDTKLEIPKTDVTFLSAILGSGAFGQVVKGTYQGSPVAIKMLKTKVNQNAEYLRALLGELKVMSYLGSHPNLVGLVGAITANIKVGEVYLIFEYCSKGNAHSFVRSNRDNFADMLAPRVPIRVHRTTRMMARISGVNKLYGTLRRGVGLSTKDLVRWGHEVASGMEYVAAKNVYHGDLAARNILLTEDLTAKVGDFGLSKQLDVEKYNCYVQKKECPLPLKWMAIESLRDLTFSIRSDVWSYGVTLWELFTLGQTPYPGMDWNFESWKLLCEGNRLGKPDYASDSIYTIMMSCWHGDPKARPSFAQLRDLMYAELHKL